MKMVDGGLEDVLWAHAEIVVKDTVLHCRSAETKREADHTARSVAGFSLMETHCMAMSEPDMVAAAQKQVVQQSIPPVKEVEVVLLVQSYSSSAVSQHYDV